MGASRWRLWVLGCAWFLLQVQLWFPVWVTFLVTARGLSLADVVIADAAFSAAVLLLEVPLGSVADMIGHRRTLLIGAALASVTQLLVVSVSGLPSLLGVWLVWGCSVSLISGTETAYRYEAIRVLGLERRSVAIFGAFGATAALAMVLSHGLAGFVYQVDPRLPFVINAGCAALGTGLLFLGPRVELGCEVERAQGLIDGARKMLQRLIEDSTSRLLLLALAGVTAFHWTTTLVLQPLLLEHGFSPGRIGLVYAVAGAGAAMGNLLASSARRAIGFRQILAVGMTIQVVAVLLSSAGSRHLALLGICVHPLALGLVDPTLRVALNRRVSSNVRASLLSYVSLTGTGIMLLSRPVVGLVAEDSGPSAALRLWFFVGVGALVVALVVMRRLPTVSSGDTDTAALPPSRWSR